MLLLSYNVIVAHPKQHGSSCKKTWNYYLLPSITIFVGSTHVTIALPHPISQGPVALNLHTSHTCITYQRFTVSSRAQSPAPLKHEYYYEIKPHIMVRSGVIRSPCVVEWWEMIKSCPGNTYEEDNAIDSTI